MIANQKETDAARVAGAGIIDLVAPLIPDCHPDGTEGWSQNLGEMALQTLLAGCEGREVSMAYLFQGLGITLGSYLAQLPDVERQRLAITALNGGIAMGMADFARDMSPAGQA